MYNLSSLQSTVYNLQCTVYSVQCTVYRVQSTVYNVVFTVQCTLYTVPEIATVSIQCMLHHQTVRVPQLDLPASVAAPDKPATWNVECRI